MRFPKLRHVPLRDSPEEQLEFDTFLQLCKSADDEVDENTLLRAQHQAVKAIPDDRIEESFPLTAEDVSCVESAAVWLLLACSLMQFAMLTYDVH